MIILYCFFLCVLIQGALNPIQLPIVSPSTTGSSNTSYQFTLSANNPSITASSILVIQFLSQYRITSVGNCILNLNALASATPPCSAPGSNQIQFSNMVSSITTLSNFSVSFNSNGADYAGNTTIYIYFKEGSNNITDALGTVYVTITPSIMTSCFASSNSDMVGAQSTWSLGFTPVVTPSLTNFLKVTFNLKLGNTSNFANTTNITCSKGTCTYTSSTTTQTLNISSIFSVATVSQQSLSISTMYNPYSTYAITITYQVMYSSLYQIQRCTADLKVSTASNVMSASLSPSLSTAISATNTNIQINLVQSIPIPTNAYYLITTPLSISYTPVNVLGTLPNVTTGTNTILIGNLTSVIIDNFYTLSSFSITNPTSTKSVPIIVASLIITNSVYYYISQSTINVTPAASTITSSTINFSPKNANTIATYQLSFITINNLIAGSFVVITFPTETTLNINSTCQSNFGSCICNPASSSINITLTSSLINSSNITTNITNILNPYTTITTSSFKISTYYNSLDSLVDTLTSGLTVKSDPNSFLTSALNIINPKVGGISTYELDIQFKNVPLVGSVLSITFPSPVNVSNMGSSICSLSASGNVVTLQNCFNSSSTNTLKVNFTNIRNPISTSQSTISTINMSYNNSIVEYLNSLLTIKMISLASLTASITISNSTVNANSTYIFSILFSQPHQTNDTLSISIPTTITSISNLQCSAVSGLSSISCSYINSNLTITLGFNTFPNNYSIQFSISTFKNNWYVSNVAFTITSLSSSRYQMETGSASVAYSVGTLDVTVSNDQNIVLLSNSSVAFTISPPFSISSDNISIKIVLPSLSLNASACTSTNGNCLIINNLLTISNINGFTFSLIISINAVTGYFTTTPLFPITLSYNTNQIAINPNVSVSAFCAAPCKQCQSTNRSSCRSCLPAEYTALIYLIPSTQSCSSQCPSSTYLSNLTCLSCNSNCFNCSTSSTQCTSCKTGTYLFNSTCYGVCPDGTYSNIDSCENCNPSCKTCSTLLQCTGCYTNQYLFNSTCLSQCPVSYYPDIASNCQSCGICQLCTSPTNCSSCKNSYFLLNSRCYESCPSTFPIPSEGTCLACDPTCLTCQNTTINCLSCHNSTYLYNNKCLQSCPETLSPNSLTNRCESVDKSMIYFPGLISSSVLIAIVIFSKIFFRSTSVTTSLVGLLAYPQFIVYCYYLYLVLLENKKTELALTAAGLAVLIALSISFVIICIRKIHLADQYYKHWYNSYKAISWIFNILSCLNYKAYRLTYSKLFNLESLSSIFKISKRILYLSTGITIAGTIFVQILISISCITTLYLSTLKNQLFYQSIDTIIISSIISIISIVDIPKSDEYFLSSSFLSNKVHVLDGKNNLIDQVDDAGGNGLEQHQTGYGKGHNKSGYLLQTGGYYDGSMDKIRLGEESLAESLNTGMIQFESETLKNLNQREGESREESKGVFDKDEDLLKKLNELDNQEMQQELAETSKQKSLSNSLKSSNHLSDKVSPNKSLSSKSKRSQSQKKSSIKQKLSQKSRLKSQPEFLSQQQQISQIRSISKNKKSLTYLTQFSNSPNNNCQINSRAQDPVNSKLLIVDLKVKIESDKTLLLSQLRNTIGLLSQCLVKSS